MSLSAPVALTGRAALGLTRLIGRVSPAELRGLDDALRLHLSL